MNDRRVDPLIPAIGVVTDIRIDTPDVKTFRVLAPDGKKPFPHKPGSWLHFRRSLIAFRSGWRPVIRG